MGDKELEESLKINCSKCFGFCCTALYFSKNDGFPVDKEGGKPCVNLMEDFKCKIHNDLTKKGLKGCIAYDCLGAGQKVASVTYNGHSFRENKELAKEMFDVFIIMTKLHEMLWYLNESLRLDIDNSLKSSIKDMLNKTLDVTNLDAKSLLSFDLEFHRDNVNILLEKVSEFIRRKAQKGNKPNFKCKKMIGGRKNLIGQNLCKQNLVGADFRGAELSYSIFLTQMQLNVMKGDLNTKIPVYLKKPQSWRNIKK